MKTTIEILTPKICPFRYDASAYPGGDFRCGLNNINIKCGKEISFPEKCPLKKKHIKIEE